MTFCELKQQISKDSTVHLIAVITTAGNPIYGHNFLF